MQKKLAALLVISLMAMHVAYFPPTAVSDPTEYGPRLEHVRYMTYELPQAQLLSMLVRDTEFLTGITDPRYIRELEAAGRVVVSTPRSHFCEVGFNLRNWWLGPKDGSDGPGRALRHAIAHLIPKDELIGQYLRRIAKKIDALGSPAQGEWYPYKGQVDPHDYDPDMAHDILTSGGWTWDAVDSRWELAVSFMGKLVGTPMPTTYMYSPESDIAPTSWEIIRTSVERMTGAGPFATQPLPVVHEPINFYDMLNILFHEPNRSSSHAQGGWDSYFCCYGLGETATFLFSFFHSSQDREQGFNQVGLRSNTLDAELEILQTSLDHTTKVDAAITAHELLMGSPANQLDPWTDGIIARIPIYSRVACDAIDEGLKGVVQALLTGLEQGYTWNNMYWQNPFGHESDLVPGGDMLVFCNQRPLQTPLNPAYLNSLYGPHTWCVIGYLYDTLVKTNPWTGWPHAWILDATKDPDYPDTPGYYVEPWGDGMKVTYYLVDDTILWHDGHPVDAFDVEFAWEYLREYEIGLWWQTFMYFDHADVIDVPLNRTVAAYLTETSQFTPLVLAEVALMFPEHIWGCTHERGGRATPSCNSNWQNAYPGPVLVESGVCVCAPGTAQTAPLKTTCVHGCGCVIDHPATTANEVYAYDPSYYAHATAEFPWLTELVGSGPWIFRNYNPIAMVSDIVAFDAARTGIGGDPNVHYWKSTDELHDLLVDLFWEASDCDRSGRIDAWDLSIMGMAAFTRPGWPDWDVRADVNTDLVVDVRDFARICRNFGKEREL